MSTAQRISVPVTTAADGSATTYSENISGRVHSISYVKTDFADTGDFTVTAEATGQSLWTQSNVTASATVYPVQPANLGASGAASTLTEVGVVLANDRVKIVIAQGGNVKTGAFIIIVT